MKIKNPLDSITGTIVSGFLLLGVILLGIRLWVIIS